MTQPAETAAAIRVARPASLPLFVDLDGTLIRSDLLIESFWGTLRRHPLALCGLPGWLAAGRHRVKLELARLGAPAIANLPFHGHVIDFLRSEKQTGRPLILATAATRTLAEAVADHLQLFSDVLASDDRNNLKAAAKLVAIRAYCDQRSYDRFAYLGDSRADLVIWQAAAECLAVNPSTSVQRSLRCLGKPVMLLEARPAPTQALTAIPAGTTSIR